MTDVRKKKRRRTTKEVDSDVLSKTLPDHWAPNLDILIIGINPGLVAARTGHHYAGPGNHFWKCLYLSGIVPQPFTAYDDYRLLEYGIGFTNIVARTTRGSGDLKPKEIREGAKILIERLQVLKPKIAVFNGVGIYSIFAGTKDFKLGKQPNFIEGTNSLIYVMPSSSARCAQLPRLEDKLPFYIGLRKLRDFVTYKTNEINDCEITFDRMDSRTLDDKKDCKKALQTHLTVKTLDIEVKTEPGTVSPYFVHSSHCYKM